MMWGDKRGYQVTGRDRQKVVRTIHNFPSALGGHACSRVARAAIIVETNLAELLPWFASVQVPQNRRGPMIRCTSIGAAMTSPVSRSRNPHAEG